MVDGDSVESEPVQRLLEAWAGELVVSAFNAAEADHLVLSRLGVDAELRLIADLADHFTVDSLDPKELRQARDLCEQYRDLELGLADASIAVLADRWQTHSVATFDFRHFRAVVALDGEPFTLLPDDL